MKKEKDIRKRLTAREADIIDMIRANPNVSEYLNHLNEIGVLPSDVKQFWHKSKRYSIQVRGMSIEDHQKKLIKFIDDLFADRKRPVSRIQRPDVGNGGHCIVLDPADIHIGKYASVSETGNYYDIQAAVKSSLDGVSGIIERASGYKIDKAIIVIGNDVLHIDTPKRTTTSGTPQDTDGMWHEAYKCAVSMYVQMIDWLLDVCDVHIMYNPSNHDYMSGYMLAQTIEAYYRQNKNVTFDVTMKHRKYYKYGTNMIMTSHGDGAKSSDMPLIMATEDPIMWSQCPYRYVYLHHIHHKQVHKFMSTKDAVGVTIEYVRSPSATDGWHDRNGFVGTKRAVEAFIHSFNSGQVARITHFTG